MIEGYKESNLGEIPENWEVKKLGDFLNVNTGSKNAQDSKEDGVYPFFTRSVTTQNIDTYSYNTEALFIAGEGIFKVKYYKGKFDVHQRTYILTSKEGIECSMKFFQNQIQSRILRLVGTSVGSTVQSLRKPIIQNLELIYPPLPEQQKIAEILSTVDAKIDVIDQQITETQELKKGLMQRLLTKGIGHTEFKDSALGEIPLGWKVVKLGEIADVTAGGTPSTKEPNFWGGDIPWMNSGEINLRRIKAVEGRITELGLNNSSTKLIPSNSVLMALAGQGKTRGKVAINEFSLCTNQSLATIYKFQNADYEFIFQNLESRYSEIRKMSTGDGGRGGLNLTIIKSIPIALPPLREQNEISKILISFDEKLEVLSEKKTTYQELKRGLMQQLLTGKVRVKV